MNNYELDQLYYYLPYIYSPHLCVGCLFLALHPPASASSVVSSVKTTSHLSHSHLSSSHPTSVVSHDTCACFILLPRRALGRRGRSRCRSRRSLSLARVPATLPFGGAPQAEGYLPRADVSRRLAERLDGRATVHRSDWTTSRRSGSWTKPFTLMWVPLVCALAS